MPSRALAANLTHDIATLISYLAPPHLTTPRQSTTTADPQIRLICLSDTHNAQPILPDGDILLHAGDLTDSGTYTELQAQLNWLNAQPHTHKIVVGGNHDRLLDESLDSTTDALESERAETEEQPEKEKRREQSRKERAALNWGTVTCLQETSTTLTFPPKNKNKNGKGQHRRITIFGTPFTPRHSTTPACAFQRSCSVSTRRATSSCIPQDTDIILSHCPALGRLDITGSILGEDIHAGSERLLRDVMRVRPRAVVCGHVHEARGVEHIAFSRFQRAREEVLWLGGGPACVARMVLALALEWIRWILCMLGLCRGGEEGTTIIVNAAVKGVNGEVRGAVVLDI